VEGWVGTRSKVAVLTVDPRAKAQCYIMNEDGGAWDTNNIWWSNQTHIKPKVHTTYYGSDDYYKNGPYVRRSDNFYQSHKWNYKTNGFDLIEGWYETSTGDFEKEKSDDIVKIVGQLALVPPLDEPKEGSEKDEDEDDDLILCPQCNQGTDLTFDPDYCLRCHVCFGCGEKRLLCMCFTGSVWHENFGY
jgi:hypothetical protein